MSRPSKPSIDIYAIPSSIAGRCTIDIETPDATFFLHGCTHDIETYQRIHELLENASMTLHKALRVVNQHGDLQK